MQLVSSVAWCLLLYLFGLCCCLQTVCRYHCQALSPAGLCCSTYEASLCNSKQHLQVAEHIPWFAKIHRHSCRKSSCVANHKYVLLLLAWYTCQYLGVWLVSMLPVLMLVLVSCVSSGGVLVLITLMWQQGYRHSQESGGAARSECDITQRRLAPCCGC